MKLSLAGKEKITIREANSLDLKDVVRIEQQSFPAPWSGGMYEIETVRKESHFMVAEDGGRVVGYVLGWRVRDEGHVLKIAVEPGCRNRGVARAMMEVIEERFKKEGIREMWLEARQTNLQARNLYLKLGFQEAGVRPAYYSDNGDDAVLLVKNI